jgi:hypothetical protein
MRRVYAFDVDETLEVSNGPVSLGAVLSLRWDGHIIGLCGNYAAVTTQVFHWDKIFSFIGPMGLSKEAFLGEIQKYCPADEYVMVGNILGVSGSSDDQGAAERSGWRFIKESAFAEGAR